MIKVLLVDDSQIALAILKKMLLSAPDIHIVGTARNGKEALELIPLLVPDVICTDLYMPVMDGLELTKAVMERHPKPILVVSVSVQKDSVNAFRLLEAGAVDVFLKPRSGSEADYLKQADDLRMMIRVLSGVRVFRRITKEPVKGLRTEEEHQKPPPLRIIGIGASTGGPQALQYILSKLHQDFPLPIVCVQHISDGFLRGLVDWLQSACAVKIEIAREHEQPLPGAVYLPRENAHLIMDEEQRFRYSLEPPFNGHRPSISITFGSMAKRYRRSMIGVLLTGMGNDGAAGMEAIAKEGGITIAQDEKTSVVFSMPKHAIELGAARYVLPLEEIPSVLIKKIFLNNGWTQGQPE